MTYLGSGGEFRVVFESLELTLTLTLQKPSFHFQYVGEGPGWMVETSERAPDSEVWEFAYSLQPAYIQ